MAGDLAEMGGGSGFERASGDDRRDAFDGGSMGVIVLVALAWLLFSTAVFINGVELDFGFAEDLGVVVTITSVLLVRAIVSHNITYQASLDRSQMIRELPISYSQEPKLTVYQ